jgi:hypothetical protein
VGREKKRKLTTSRIVLFSWLPFDSKETTQTTTVVASSLMRYTF